MPMPVLSLDPVPTDAYLALTDVMDSPVTLRLVFAGTIDCANADWFADYVFAALGEFNQFNIQVDLDEVHSIDSAGVRSLLACHRRATAENRQFAVVNPAPTVHRILHITGIADLLLHTPDLPQPGPRHGL
jgi:anti-anti-sigma factor